MANPHYRVVVKTGNIESAGTDAKVHIQLLGSQAEGPLRRLDNPANNFVRGHSDTFAFTDYEDVGWINAIRLMHDNSGRKPGWYVDDVTVTNEDAGIAFHADFNCWLDRNRGTDATKPTRLTGVTLDGHDLTRMYVGYGVHRVHNSASPVTLSEKLEFATRVKTGFSLVKTTGYSIAANASLGASFFGVSSQFSLAVSRSASTMFTSVEEEEREYTYELSLDTPPGKDVTGILLWYQDVTSGMAHSEEPQVRIGFQQRDPPQEASPVFQEGWLSDAEVEQLVAYMLRSTVGESGGDVDVVPARVPNIDAFIPVATERMSGRLTLQGLRVAREALRRHPLVRAATIPEMRWRARTPVHVTHP